jgi:hypothetical protein
MPGPDMKLRENDHAVLVGVADYPLAKYAPLQGPPHDVEEFRKWLVSEHGGQVPPNQVKILVSPDPALEQSQDYPPTEREFWQHLRGITQENGGPKRRDGRLYLYFSGHGFASFVEKDRHAALFMGNAEPFIPANVCGTYVAEWCRRAAVFKEIVLVMDCCRDEQLQRQPWISPFADFHDPQLAKGVSVVSLYATPYDRKAHEVDVGGGRRVGLFTFALLMALNCAPHDSAANGQIGRTSHSVRKYLKSIWNSVVGNTGMDPPDFEAHNDEDLVFSTSPPGKLKRRVVFEPALASPARLLLRDDNDQVVHELLLDPVAGTASVVVPAGLPAQEFNGAGLDLELAPQLFELELIRAEVPPHTQSVNPLGGTHVRVNL